MSAINLIESSYRLTAGNVGVGDEVVILRSALPGLLPNNVHLLLSEDGSVNGKNVSFGNGHC